MPYNAAIAASVNVTSGPTKSFSKSLTTFAGLHVVDAEEIPISQTDQVVTVGAGATSGITAVYMYFDDACTFKIDSGTLVNNVTADDCVFMSGAIAKSILDDLSNGTNFNQILVTTTASQTPTITIVVMTDVTP